jgi:hypothetical protein
MSKVQFSGAQFFFNAAMPYGGFKELAIAAGAKIVSWDTAAFNSKDLPVTGINTPL